MCSRYTLTTPASILQRWLAGRDTQLRLSLVFPDGFEPHYNIAPTQTVLVVKPGASGPEPALMRWGFAPSWSKDGKGQPLINARAETVFELPSFRVAARDRRCLVLADGFIEWRHEGKDKQPIYFQLKEGEPFAFAGLWERQGDAPSCTILTTQANALVSEVHGRMPVILPPEAYQAWLEPEQHDPAALLPLLAPYPADRMTARPISKRVSSYKNTDVDVLGPPDEPPPSSGQLSLF